MFDRILVVLDELNDREAVLPHLRRFAGACATHLILMKTVPFVDSLMEMPHDLSPEVEADDEEIYVSALAEALTAEGIDAEGFTNLGQSGLSIAAAAERVDASLIVAVASQPRLRIGPLLAATRIPVCLVPSRGSAPLGRILILFDGTPASLEVLPTATALAQRFSSGIVFLRTVTSPSQVGLAEVRNLLSREGVPSQFVVPAGAPAAEIVRLVHDSGAPVLIVRQSIPSVVEMPVSIPSRGPLLSGLGRRRVGANPLDGVGVPWD